MTTNGIFGLFKDVFNIASYVASNDRVTGGNGLERVGKKVVIA
jgi:hypothetical protein